MPEGELRWRGRGGCSTGGGCGIVVGSMGSGHHSGVEGRGGEVRTVGKVGVGFISRTRSRDECLSRY